MSNSFCETPRNSVGATRRGTKPLETEKEVQATMDALQGQKTILIVARRMSTVERCDQVFALCDHSIRLTEGVRVPSQICRFIRI